MVFLHSFSIFRFLGVKETKASGAEETQQQRSKMLDLLQPGCMIYLMIISIAINLRKLAGCKMGENYEIFVSHPSFLVSQYCCRRLSHKQEDQKHHHSSNSKPPLHWQPSSQFCSRSIHVSAPKASFRLRLSIATQVGCGGTQHIYIMDGWTITGHFTLHFTS